MVWPIRGRQIDRVTKHILNDRIQTVQRINEGRKDMRAILHVFSYFIHQFEIFSILSLIRTIISEQREILAGSFQMIISPDQL